MRYFDWYASDIAWREDTRRVDMGNLTRSLLGQALRRPTSRYLCGYWQGNKPPILVWMSERKRLRGLTGRMPPAANLISSACFSPMQRQGRGLPVG